MIYDHDHDVPLTAVEIVVYIVLVTLFAIFGADLIIETQYHKPMRQFICEKYGCRTHL